MRGLAAGFFLAGVLGRCVGTGCFVVYCFFLFFTAPGGLLARSLVFSPLFFFFYGAWGLLGPAAFFFTGGLCF